jgi:hypothetical protein
MSQQQAIAQCREPSNPGEKLVAALPGMQITPDGHEFDFVFVPKDLRVEVKYGGSSLVPSTLGPSVQFRWTNIKQQKFDWLILTGLHDDQWHLWLIPAGGVRLVKSRSGVISCVINPVRPPRPKAEWLSSYSKTYEELHACCLKGVLE